MGIDISVISVTWQTIISLTVLLCTTVFYVDTKVFHLGIVAPWNGFYAVGSHSAGAALIALDKIRSDNVTFSEIHKAGHDFDFQWRDTKCTPKYGIPAIAELIIEDCDISSTSVDAIIGPTCSIVCEPGGYLANHWNKPMISFGCVSNLLSDKSVYPTFARTYGTNHYGMAYIRVFQIYNFRRIAIFSSKDGLYISLSQSIRKLCYDSGISVTYYSSFGGDSRGLRDVLKILKGRCRGNVNIGRYNVFVSLFKYGY